LDKVTSKTMIFQLGNSYPYINPLNPEFPSTISTMVVNMKQTYQTKVDDASGNIQEYFNNTQVLLNNAIVKSQSVTDNLRVLASLYSFGQAVAEALSFPLVQISGKEILVTQNIPSIILNDGINITNNALVFLDKLILNITDPSTNIISSSDLNNSNTLANNLDVIARVRDNNLYFRETIQNNLKRASIVKRKFRQTVSIPNLPFNAYDVAVKNMEISALAAAARQMLEGSLIVANASTKQQADSAARQTILNATEAASKISTTEARKFALNSDKSAQNARSVYNSMDQLYYHSSSNITKQPIIETTAKYIKAFIYEIMETVDKVTSNTSAHSGVAISRVASNTILGNIKVISEKLEVAMNNLSDANSVLDLLKEAYNKARIEDKKWASNAASARATEVVEILRKKVYELNRNARKLLTPEKIAVMTSSANYNGSLNSNYISNLDRTSRNVYPSPPPAYNGFKADIRAKTFIPVGPPMGELLYKNTIQPLRLDSLRTINDVIVKVTQEVQEVKDKSAFSFKK